MLSDRTLCDYRVHIMHHRASHLLMLSLSRLGCRVAKLCSSLNFTLTLLAVIEVMDHVFDIPGTQMSQSKISRGRGMTFAHHPRRWGLMTSEACWHFLHPAVNGDWCIRVEIKIYSYDSEIIDEDIRAQLYQSLVKECVAEFMSIIWHTFSNLCP